MSHRLLCKEAVSLGDEWSVVQWKTVEGLGIISKKNLGKEVRFSAKIVWCV